MESIYCKKETQNQIKHLELIATIEYSKFFIDIEKKNRNCEYNRKYYLRNREKIIKEKMVYNKTGY